MNILASAAAVATASAVDFFAAYEPIAPPVRRLGVHRNQWKLSEDHGE
jgi:hypothetical protein